MIGKQVINACAGLVEWGILTIFALAIIIILNISQSIYESE